MTFSIKSSSSESRRGCIDVSRACSSKSVKSEAPSKQWYNFLLTSAKRIQEYIQNQLKEDKIAEQMELELEDPFTGRKK